MTTSVICMILMSVIGLLYLGYTIGIIHGAVVNAREMKKKDETVNLYQTMVAEMSTMINAFLEKQKESEGGEKA